MKEIQDKISKLEVVVNSKMIPDSVKAKAKAEIEKLKEELKETKVEEKAEKPKKEVKEKKEPKEKAESKKSEMSLKDCEDLLAKYKAEREARKERAEKREKQGKPAELTPAETAKKAVDRVTDKIEAKAEKGKSVKGDIKAVFNQFKSAVAELKKYKDEIDQEEVRNLIKELESLLTKKMAKGGGVGADAKKLSEEGQFELKVLQSVKGYNDGLTINGILENMGMSNYRFNEDASSSNMKKVKKSLESLIKKGFIEESGLGYEITREGANYLRTFSYGTY